MECGYGPLTDFKNLLESVNIYIYGKDHSRAKATQNLGTWQQRGPVACDGVHKQLVPLGLLRELQYGRVGYLYHPIGTMEILGLTVKVRSCEIYSPNPCDFLGTVSQIYEKGLVSTLLIIDTSRIGSICVSNR